MKIQRRKHRTNKSQTPDGFKTCFVSRETHPREELLRFVASPDHVVYFDATEKLPGRGMWLRADREIVQKAIAKKMFSKAAGEGVKTPEGLEEQVAIGLRMRALSLMGMARKAGALVFGYEAVKKALAGGTAVLAFEADDSSERGKDKLYHYEQNLKVCSLFTREELGQVIGQEAAVHVGVLKNKVATELAKVVHKLELFSQQNMKG